MAEKADLGVTIMTTAKTWSPIGPSVFCARYVDGLTALATWTRTKSSAFSSEMPADRHRRPESSSSV